MVKKMKYNYYEAVKNDVADNIGEYYTPEELREELQNGNRQEVEERLNDKMWTDDSITGNGSGSYTFNTYEAEENLAHNWDEIERTAAEFGYTPEIKDGYEMGPEWWDVSIRCYYLSQAIAEVLDEIESEL